MRLFLLVACQRASQEVRFTPAHGHGNDQGAGLDESDAATVRSAASFWFFNFSRSGFSQ